MVLSASSEPVALASGMSFKASTMTRNRSAPVAFAPCGQVKPALRAIVAPAPRFCCVNAWFSVAMSWPVVRFSTSTRSVHAPMAAVVPALPVVQCTVTASPPFQSAAGSTVKPVACKFT